MTRDWEIRDGAIRQAEALKVGVDATRRRFLEAHGGTETTDEILIKDNGTIKHYLQKPDGWKLVLQTTSGVHDPEGVYGNIGSFVGVRYANFRAFQDPEPTKGLDAINRIRDSFFNQGPQSQNMSLGPDDSTERAELEIPATTGSEDYDKMPITSVEDYR